MFWICTQAQESQLDKVRLEKKFLEEELKLLQDAMPVDDAAAKLMEYVSNKPDPLQLPNENEWVAAGGSGGCCTIS